MGNICSFDDFEDEKEIYVKDEETYIYNPISSSRTLKRRGVYNAYMEENN